MKKSRWLVRILGAGVLGGLGWLWLGQTQQSVILRGENQSLRQQLARLAELTADNERLSNLVAQADHSQSNQQLLEVLRLRNEVALLRRLTNEFHLTREELAQQRAVAAAVAGTGKQITNSSGEPLAVYPKEKWEFVGYDTPENAFQSLNWSALTGDLGTLKSNLTEEAQQEFARSFENKSETQIREQLAQIFNEKQEVRIMSKEVINDNLVVLGVTDGKDVASVDRLVFQKINGQWKFVTDH